MYVVFFNDNMEHSLIALLIMYLIKFACSTSPGLLQCFMEESALSNLIKHYYILYDMLCQAY